MNRNHAWKTLIVVALIALGTVQAVADTADAERIVREVLRTHIEAGELLGASVVLDNRGEDLIAVSVGRSIPGDPGKPFDPDQSLNIGSVTKVFVAVVVLQLSASGHLDLDASVEAWLPDLPDAGRVSIRNLLQHTSGLNEYLESPEVQGDAARAWSHQELVDAALRLGPVGEPGEAFAYANTGYVLLGRIIESVTGRPWYAEVRSRILDPLGMEGTGYPEDPMSPAMGPGYRPKGAEFVDATDVWHISLGGAAGGLVSTAADLMTFTKAMRDGRLLDADSSADMRSFIDAERHGHIERSYGLGWERYVANELTLEGHLGSGSSNCAFVGLDPETGTAVTVVINVLQPGLPALIAAEIVGRVTGRNIAPPQNPSASVSVMHLPESRLVSPLAPEATDLGVRVDTYDAEVLFPMSGAGGESTFIHALRYKQLRIGYGNRSEDLGPLVERAHMIGYGLTWFRRLDPKWTLLTIFNPGIASDFEGDLGFDDLVLEMAVVGIRTVNDRWALGFGTGYNPRFGQHYPMPVLAVRWNDGDKQAFEAILPMSMTYRYLARPGLELGLGLELEGNSYHGDPEIYGVENPQMRYSLARFGTSVEFGIGPGANLSLKSGIAFGRRFEFFDGMHEVASYDLASAGFVQASVVVGR